MVFLPTTIDGVWIIEPEPRVDERGLFARVWCDTEVAAHGLETNLVQANTAFSHQKGTLRGMHYQRGAAAEAKIVRCTAGAVYDVALDLRPGSPTLHKWVGVELSADNRRMLYIPRGCAHGYQTRLDGTELWYGTSNRYAPDMATGVRYDDPAFGIEWPEPITSISAADAAWPILGGASAPAARS